MAPPRRILREQQEMIMDCLEGNKSMAKGLPSGVPAPQNETRHKWAVLAKKLNSIDNGAMKTSDGWRKYWFEWRHKCRRKAADSRRFEPGAHLGKNRFIPLNDLEIRVLQLTGLGAVSPPDGSNADKNEVSYTDNSDSDEPLERKHKPAPPIKLKRLNNSISKVVAESLTVSEEDSQTTTQPPKWAMQLEERRIAAQERMAEALASMAEMMRNQEDRRSMLDERIADALTNMAGTMQDLNNSVQEMLQHSRQIRPMHNGDQSTENNYYTVTNVTD